MTIEEQIKDAVQLLFSHLDKAIINNNNEEWKNWFNSIPILIVTPVNTEACQQIIFESLLKWVKDFNIYEHNGFIIQNRQIFDTWYKQLKLNNDK